MAKVNQQAAATVKAASPAISIDLPFRTPVQCPIGALKLDLNNPRLQTGDAINAASESIYEVLFKCSRINFLRIPSPFP